MTEAGAALPPLFSADDHVQEHPRVWSDRLSSTRWGERIPHVAQQPDGTERWVIDGGPVPLSGVARTGSLLADRNREPQRWADVPRAAYEPAERLHAMDADGVAVSVLYPTVAGDGGEAFGHIDDPELELACVQAYNDWLIEEWAAASPRFIPQCIVPLYPAEAAAAEVRRAVTKGHRGVVYPPVPMELRKVPHLNGPEYDPLWAVCAELEVPICFHAGAATSIQVPANGLHGAVADAYTAIAASAASVSLVVNALISGILQRHPSLKVVFAESSLGWGAYLLEFTDHQAHEDALHLEGFEQPPSELFRRQCYLTGWYDRAGVQVRQIIGTGSILWSTQFPLATSTYPSTQQRLAESFAGVDEATTRRLLWENAAELYKVGAAVTA